MSFLDYFKDIAREAERNYDPHAPTEVKAKLIKDTYKRWIVISDRYIVESVSPKEILSTYLNFTEEMQEDYSPEEYFESFFNTLLHGTSD